MHYLQLFITFFAILNMTKPIQYHKRTTWKYPEELILKIKEDISEFYKKIEHPYENFTKEDTYEPLRSKIFEKTGKKPTLRWLKDFKTNQKDSIATKKTYFEALLTYFDYDFSYQNNSFKKKNFSEKKPEIVDEFDKGFKLKVKTTIHKFSAVDKKMLKLFCGTYKYFIGARKDSIYDYIYENELEIFETGEVKIYNPFSKTTYHGIAFTRNQKNLQILSFDFNNSKVEGVGNLMTFKVNLYGRSLILIPGISLTFDADLRPIASQALLCSDTSTTKKSKPIREYYDKIAKELRLNCPDLDKIEKLRNRYFQAPINVTVLRKQQKEK